MPRMGRPAVLLFSGLRVISPLGVDRGGGHFLLGIKNDFTSDRGDVIGCSLKARSYISAPGEIPPFVAMNSYHLGFPQLLDSGIW